MDAHAQFALMQLAIAHFEEHGDSESALAVAVYFEDRMVVEPNMRLANAMLVQRDKWLALAAGMEVT